MWRDLESLTMPSIANPPYLMEEIAQNCRNFRELKIMGPFDLLFASTLNMYLPKLKVLSLRCTTLNRDALILILDGLQNLEVLNISHCLLIDVPLAPAPKKIIKKLDRTILQKAARLRKFLTCMEDSCIMCQRTKNDEGIMRWYKYEEGLWKDDEVSSLALWLPEHYGDCFFSELETIAYTPFFFLFSGGFGGWDWRLLWNNRIRLVNKKHRWKPCFVVCELSSHLSVSEHYVYKVTGKWFIFGFSSSWSVFFFLGSSVIT